MKKNTSIHGVALLLVMTMSLGCIMPDDGIDDIPIPLEAVDLGLPSGVLWASHNLLADRPWHQGGMFRWGETLEKDKSQGYSFFDENNLLTGYNWNEDLGIVDNQYILNPENDAATEILGEQWRTPTEWDFQELKDNCDWVEETIKGVTGYRVYSRKNSNSIFIPSQKKYGSIIVVDVDYYTYWTSCIGRHPTGAIAFDAYLKRCQGEYRQSGFYIRPVLAHRSHLESIALTDSTLNKPAGFKTKLNILFTPIDALDRYITWKSSNDSVVHIDDNGLITALYPGTTSITAVSRDSGFTVDMKVTVTDYIVPEKVDMGLPSGLLWGDRNLGSVKETDEGLKFAWGEIRPRILFSQNNYIGNKYLPKDGSMSSETDAATVLLGPGWRYPSVDDISELVENSLITFDQEMNLFTLVSKLNGNILHLSALSYWTSTPYNSTQKYCYRIGEYGNNSLYYYQLDYYQGVVIRPVFSEEKTYISP